MIYLYYCATLFQALYFPYFITTQNAVFEAIIKIDKQAYY